MSSRYRSDPEMMINYQQKPTACSNFLHYTWKTITCLVSHITLISMVISYCALGAFTFEALEKEHEKNVKRNITKIRNNITDHLWKLTLDLDVLELENFTMGASIYLKEFENALLKAMTKDGWDGEEDTEKVQWTRTGALFYSIIVITTIGYGHIAPKTTWGKVATIFYAILGIPLMLLCLSNIGDIMATSFRFLYWRVCCYMCTKKPKKRKTRSLNRINSRYLDSRYQRSRTTSIRRSVRTSTRSADSGIPLSESLPYSHSDTDLRYHHHHYQHYPNIGDGLEYNRRGSSLPRLQRHSTSRYSDATTVTLRRSQPKPPLQQPQQQPIGGSLDRKKFPKGMLIELDPILLARTPILCNKYVIGKNEMLTNQAPGITSRDMEVPIARRAKSLPKHQKYLDIPPLETSTGQTNVPVRNRPKRKRSPPRHNTSPKMMTPLGYGHRSKYLDDPDTDNDDDDFNIDDYHQPYYDDNNYYNNDYYDIQRTRTRPVPIWLCVFLVVSYIIAGAFLFRSWENWELLDAAYFCFITLTTIGFGDLVPAKGVKQDGYRATISIALCSLYLLFGIALLAMSFNLVQEEVIANVKSVAKTLGIIKKDSDDSGTDDEDDV